MVTSTRLRPKGTGSPYSASDNCWGRPSRRGALKSLGGWRHRQSFSNVPLSLIHVVTQVFFQK